MVAIVPLEHFVLLCYEDVMAWMCFQNNMSRKRKEIEFDIEDFSVVGKGQKKV